MRSYQLLDYKIHHWLYSCDYIGLPLYLNLIDKQHLTVHQLLFQLIQFLHKLSQCNIHPVGVHRLSHARPHLQYRFSGFQLKFDKNNRTFFVFKATPTLVGEAFIFYL